jgi:hypothetical protein
MGRGQTASDSDFSIPSYFIVGLLELFEDPPTFLRYSDVLSLLYTVRTEAHVRRTLT